MLSLSKKTAGRHKKTAEDYANDPIKKCADCGSIHTYKSKFWYLVGETKEEGHICNVCHHRQVYQETKFMKPQKNLPNLYMHWVKMLEKYDPEQQKRKKRIWTRRSRTI